MKITNSAQLRKIPNIPNSDRELLTKITHNHLLVEFAQISVSLQTRGGSRMGFFWISLPKFQDSLDKNFLWNGICQEKTTFCFKLFIAGIWDKVWAERSLMKKRGKNFLFVRNSVLQKSRSDWIFSKISYRIPDFSFEVSYENYLKNLGIVIKKIIRNCVSVWIGPGHFQGSHDFCGLRKMSDKWTFRKSEFNFQGRCSKSRRKLFFEVLWSDLAKLNISGLTRPE